MTTARIRPLGVIVLGTAMGGFVAFGAATLPARATLAGLVGVLLLALTTRVLWVAPFLLFIALNIVLGDFPVPNEWRAGLFAFCAVQILLLFWMKQGEHVASRDTLRTPLLIWTAVVAFSLLPASSYGVTFENWHYEALPLMLPALALAIPRQLIERRTLTKFLVALLLLSVPIIWDFTIEYLQFQRLYDPSDVVQQFRQFGLQSVKDLTGRQQGRDFGVFPWQVEGLAVWQFFTLFALSVTEHSLARRALFTFLAGWTFLMIFLWMRRTGLASMAFGVVIFAIFLIYDRRWAGLRSIARVGLLTVMITTAGLAAFSSAGINTSKLVSGYLLGYSRNLSDPSVEWRLRQHDFVRSAFAESPWIGHGFGYAIPGIRWIYSKEDADPGPYLENFGSNLLVKTGLIGFATFIWFISAVGRTLIRAARRPADPLHKGLLLGGIATLATLLFRSPLDDILVAHLTQYPLPMLLAIAVYGDAEARER